MSDSLRYRIIDEPRPGPLQRFALPPLLVFLITGFLLPWGWLLIAVNAIALNGVHRNREIAFAIIPVALYFLTLAGLDTAVSRAWLTHSQADYVFIGAVGVGLIFAASAYVWQEQTTQLRRYLQQR
ncbi:hypothetical protein GRI97_04760 [Altererythrobacter xixiisoli]|uniref:Uncharacterized protein n=1 Tax=Croceibacterium xixiisoli TaxID=1476466 RepID=A0A6I4TQY7_9SPHN|nr:hypothetical protein [Croceibacterium xixiisoli]MXO98294.1 hypothetical protein [Croceibacterium xixiisoli]